MFCSNGLKLISHVMYKYMAMSFHLSPPLRNTHRCHWQQIMFLNVASTPKASMKYVCRILMITVSMATSVVGRFKGNIKSEEKRSYRPACWASLNDKVREYKCNNTQSGMQYQMEYWLFKITFWLCVFFNSRTPHFTMTVKHFVVSAWLFVSSLSLSLSLLCSYYSHAHSSPCIIHTCVYFEKKRHSVDKQLTYRAIQNVRTYA